jgi:hypothetical protein
MIADSSLSVRFVTDGLPVMGGFADTGAAEGAIGALLAATTLAGIADWAE